MKKKDTNYQIGKYILAVILGLAISLFAIATGFLHFTISRAIKLQPYAEQSAEEQKEPEQLKQEDEEQENVSYTDSMEGFQVGQEKTSTDTKTASDKEENTPVKMEGITSVKATSELSENNMVHSADRICDGDLKKAWVEGTSEQGIGESITFDFEDNYCVSGMIINAGYQKTKDLYYKNSRPKKIKIVISDGSYSEVELKDIYGKQKIKFDKPVVTNQIVITIEDIYEGNKYQDTAISEISWY